FVLVGDPAPEQVADVRSERVDFALLAVEGQGEEAALGDPVVRVEAPLEICGLLGEALGRRRVAPELARQSGTTLLSGLDIAPHPPPAPPQPGPRAVAAPA